MKVNKYGQVAPKNQTKTQNAQVWPNIAQKQILDPACPCSNCLRAVTAMAPQWAPRGARGKKGQQVRPSRTRSPQKRGKTHKCGSISHRNKSWTTACPCLNSLYVVTVTPRGALWVVTAAQRLLSCSVFSDVCMLLKSMLCFWPFSYNSHTFVLVLVRIGQNDNFLTDLHFVDTF